MRPADVKNESDVQKLWTSFIETDTLQATFRVGQAEALFELGRKLVQKNWEELRKKLDDTKRFGSAPHAAKTTNPTKQPPGGQN